MSLLPYALRPKVVLRNQVIKRGVIGGSTFWRPVAMLLVGQGDFLRARALRHGLVLGSTYWRVIGVGLLLGEVRKRVLTKEAEHIARERVRIGRHVTVELIEPSTARRGRKAELARLQAEAESAIAASRRR